MTDNDWKLLERAHNTKAVDNQLVDKMIPLADTEECRELLRLQASYLYAKEEEMADYFNLISTKWQN